MPPVVSLPCPACRGVRVHTVEPVAARSNHTERRARCSTCHGLRPIPPDARPGLACPSCDHIRLKTVAVEREPARVIRTRRCRHCGETIRTAEEMLPT